MGKSQEVKWTVYKWTVKETRKKLGYFGESTLRGVEVMGFPKTNLTPNPAEARQRRLRLLPRSQARPADRGRYVRGKKRGYDEAEGQFRFQTACA